MSSTILQQAGTALTPELEAIGQKYLLNKVETRYLGPLLLYIDAKDNIKEFVVNEPGSYGYEYFDGTWEWFEAPELTLDRLEDAARMLANFSGEIFTPDHPILSCKMPGGHRVQVVAGNNTSKKFTLTVRIANRRDFSIDDFKLEPEVKQQIIDAIVGKKTLLISGGTSTGKTSFLNAVLRYIPEHERLITMEDVPELKVSHKNWAPLIFGGVNRDPTGNEIREILNACLRMRPDRILLGEIRKENAFAFCSAINTGHEGSMATIHANSAKMAMEAVINRVLLNGEIAESAISSLRRQLEDDIYGVVQLTREGDGVRAVFEILQK